MVASVYAPYEDDGAPLRATPVDIRVARVRSVAGGAVTSSRDEVYHSAASPGPARAPS